MDVTRGADVAVWRGRVTGLRDRRVGTVGTVQAATAAQDPASTRPEAVVGVIDFTRARKASTSAPLDLWVSTAPPLSVVTGVFD